MYINPEINKFPIKNAHSKGGHHCERILPFNPPGNLSEASRPIENVWCAPDLPEGRSLLYSHYVENPYWDAKSLRRETRC